MFTSLGIGSSIASAISTGAFSAAPAFGVSQGAVLGAAVSQGVSYGALAADVALAGVGLSAASQYQAGKQQEANMEYNAQLQANQAKQEEQAAAYDAELKKDEGRRILASQRAGYAASGVTAAGTPLVVFGKTAADIARDSQLIRYGGQRKSSYYKSQSALSLMQGRSASRAGTIGAGSSLLSGAANSLYQYRTM